jgi:large subunit ribosomal protein L35
MNKKQKIHSGAKKRFGLTGTGKLKRRSAYSSHLLGHKSQDQKNRYKKDINLSKGDTKNVKKMLGI